MDIRYGPKKPFIIRRMKFKNRKRRGDQSVENYVQTLQTLAETRVFGQKLYERVMDQLIRRIKNPNRQQDLVKACDSNIATDSFVGGIDTRQERTALLQTYNVTIIRIEGNLSRDRSILYRERAVEKKRITGTTQLLVA
ncbi:hypothetical protein RF11_02555 [Thelohanellus kitauei]|uniref:Retrotransposon gag domain-containing protein n=1 Tax=Thelohanellus kitauei TaxID=669202 RepID=A0A0C2J4Z7_THEKT|nr:hypothetical protein RF11_02555 [Thelohanellus kitauei]